MEPSGWWWVVTTAPWLTRRRRRAATVASRPPSSPMATRWPARVRGPWRSRSRSRTEVTSSVSSCRVPNPRSSATVEAPAIPSTAVRRCAGTRPGPPRSGRRRSRRPDRCRTQGAQPLLQLSDIVAPEHGRPAVEEPVSEPPTGLDQGRPGLGPQTPSTRRPRRYWKASTAALVPTPKVPDASIPVEKPRRSSRRWTSATGALVPDLQPDVGPRLTLDPGGPAAGRAPPAPL